MAKLIAIGISDGPAASSAIAYRLVTFYLRIRPGETLAMRWMKSLVHLNEPPKGPSASRLTQRPFTRSR
jgi:hypothetical protein